ncbi:MAG: type I-U CRISPR-associated protein Csb2 [Myxococcota bacterium]
MPNIRIRFPGGRYHATPWGQHVNEGAVEWPPSPWRLLRALIAVGFATEGWEQVPEQAEKLLNRLASSLPEYWLPPAQLAQSRHYMPLTKLKGGREDTTLVFDTWARVTEPVHIRWNVSLPPDEEVLFTRLVEQLGYLGRAESRVEVNVVAMEELPQDAPNVRPTERFSLPGPGWEQVSLLAPEPPERYQSWRQAQLLKATAHLGPPTPKEVAKVKKERQKLEAVYPEHLLAALLKDTAWLQEQGWSQPPGSQRSLYWRKADALEVGRARASFSSGAERRMQLVLLAITPPSGNFHVLPTVYRTLPQAELLHRDLVGWLNREGTPDRATELIGCDLQREPLRGHQHGHLLPVDLDGDQRLDHILVWAPGGLGFEARKALHAVQRTYTKGGAEPLRLAVALAGNCEHLYALPEPWHTQVERLLGPPEGACVWESLTPLIPGRHVKKRGKNTFEGQLNAELEQRGFPPAQVEILPREPHVEFRHFVRERRSGEAPPSFNPWAVRLTFEIPVQGPLCLGYGSHFGLGMFAARLS